MMQLDAGHTFRVFDNRSGDEVFLGKWAPKAKHSAAFVDGNQRVIVEPRQSMPSLADVCESLDQERAIPPKFVFNVIFGPAHAPRQDQQPALFVTCDAGRKLVEGDLA